MGTALLAGSRFFGNDVSAQTSQQNKKGFYLLLVEGFISFLSGWSEFGLGPQKIFSFCCFWHASDTLCHRAWGSVEGKMNGKWFCSVARMTQGFCTGGGTTVRRQLLFLVALRASLISKLEEKYRGLFTVTHIVSFTVTSGLLSSV